MEIWRGYDQAGLDAQYSTRSQIGDLYESWAAQWRERSKATRERRFARVDLAYGPDPRHRLDLFVDEASARGPLAVFFHGGFWRSRDKSDYSYVADGLSALGGSVALVNYPLCPKASLREVTRSARRAVRWLLDHAAEFGIGAQTAIVCGHSAGAHLAAMCFSGSGDDPDELPPECISGALLTSGLYELEPVRLSFANSDIRLDEAAVRDLSPARLRPIALSGPALIAYGGAETQEFAWQAQTLARGLSACGISASTLVLPEANHYTIVPELAVADSSLMRAFRAALDAAHPTGGGGDPGTAPR